MKSIAVLCVLLLAISVSARTQAQEVVRERPVTLQLDVDAQGQVTAAKAMGPVRLTDSSGHQQRSWYPALSKVVSSAAEKVASNWRFEPPKVDGKPVAGRTYAQATLQIVKHGDGTFRVKLTYRGNGAFLDYRVAPIYPMRMRRLSYDAGLVADAQVAPDGSVGEIHVLKVFTRASDHGAAFAKAAQKSISKSKGEPMHVDGRAVASHVRIAIIFNHASMEAVGGNTREMKRTRQQVNRMMRPESKQSTAVGPIRAGDVLALDSPFVKQPSG